VESEASLSRPQRTKGRRDKTSDALELHNFRVSHIEGLDGVVRVLFTLPDPWPTESLYFQAEFV
jgi:hypothetical protein